MSVVSAVKLPFLMFEPCSMFRLELLLIVRTLGRDNVNGFPLMTCGVFLLNIRIKLNDDEFCVIMSRVLFTFGALVSCFVGHSGLW